MTPEQWSVVATFLLVATTFVLVGVTGVYVVITAKILKANQRTVAVMQQQFEASFRPYIVPSTFLVPGNYMISLQISNVGKIAAEDLQLNLDKDYYPPREKEEDERSLRNAYIFQRKVTTFAPGERRVFYLGTGKDIFGKYESTRRPHQFTITATYSFSGKTVSEQTVIDLETYRESQLQPQDAVVRELKNIEAAIKKTKVKQKE